MALLWFLFTITTELRMNDYYMTRNLQPNKLLSVTKDQSLWAGICGSWLVCGPLLVSVQGMPHSLYCIQAVHLFISQYKAL